MLELAAANERIDRVGAATPMLGEARHIKNCLGHYSSLSLANSPVRY